MKDAVQAFAVVAGWWIVLNLPPETQQTLIDIMIEINAPFFFWIGALLTAVFLLRGWQWLSDARSSRRAPAGPGSRRRHM